MVEALEESREVQSDYPYSFSKYDSRESIEKQTPSLNELGQTGLKEQGGLVHEEFLRELQGENGRRVYKEMSLNDPVIAGLLFAVEMPIREVEWEFKRQSDNSQDRAAEDFLNSAKEDMSQSWADLVTEILTMLPFGWSYFELVYKRRQGELKDPKSIHNDGKIGWRKFGLRSQDSLDHWEFDDNGGLRGMWQSFINRPKPVFIPIEKAVLFRTKTTKGNPEGLSTLRTAYRPWYFKKNLEMLEAIALERMGAGYPVIYLPERWTAKDFTTAKNAVRQIRLDEQMGLTFPGPKQSATNPNGWLFELVAPASSRGVAAGFTQAITRYRSEMLMSLVASFIALGTQQVGSFALSRDQRDFFQTAIEGWLSIISDTFDRFATPKLLELNGLKPTQPVKLTHTPVGQADLRTISAFVQGLGQLGFLTPDMELEQFFRKAAGFPEKLEDDMEAAELARQGMQESGLDNNAQANQILNNIKQAAEAWDNLRKAQPSVWLDMFGLPSLEDD